MDTLKKLSKMSTHPFRQKQVRQRKTSYKGKNCKNQWARRTQRGKSQTHKTLFCSYTPWIWKALDSNTGPLIDWQCGRRNTEALEKLTRRLAVLNVKMYYTDKWQVYESMLPASKYVQTKPECIAPVDALN